MNLLECKTNGQITATVDQMTTGMWNTYYLVRLFDGEWQVANLEYETLPEAEEVAYDWAADH